MKKLIEKNTKLLETISFKPFTGYLYHIQEAYNIPEKLRHELIELCHVGFPGIEPEESIKSFINVEGKKILLLYSAKNQLAGATTIDIIPKTKTLDKTMYVSICIISPSFQRKHLASIMITYLYQLFSPEIIALTAYHPASYNIMVKLKDFVTFPQYMKKNPKYVISLAKKILDKRTRRSIFNHKFMGNDLVRRDLYPINPNEDIFLWKDNPFAQSLDLRPTDGIFTIAIRQKLNDMPEA